MLKNILKLNGAQQLSKNEQKNIQGGIKYVPEPLCTCVLVNYGVYIPGKGVTPVGTSPTEEQQASGTIIPIGFVYIQPVPECCQ